MCVQGYGYDIIERCTKQPERQNLRPVMAEFPPRDMHELIQHLDACDASTAQAIGGLLFFASEVAV
jgi:hypothetical protein